MHNLSSCGDIEIESANIYPNFIVPTYSMPSHLPLTLKNTALKKELF